MRVLLCIIMMLSISVFYFVLPDTGCLHTQAVFYAEPEQFVDTQRPHLRLCGGCERHQQQGERCLQEHVS